MGSIPVAQDGVADFRGGVWDRHGLKPWALLWFPLCVANVGPLRRLIQ